MVKQSCSKYVLRFKTILKATQFVTSDYIAIDLQEFPRVLEFRLLQTKFICGENPYRRIPEVPRLLR